MTEPLDFWKKRYDSLLEAHVQVQRQFNEAMQLIALLEAEKRQWAVEKLMQQQIIQQTLNTVNATSNSYLEENKKLKEEIQQLRSN